MKQAAEREAHLDPINADLRGPGHAGPQDVHRQRDDDALMAWKLGHAQRKSCDLKRTTSSGSMPSACGGQ